MKNIEDAVAIFRDLTITVGSSYSKLIRTLHGDYMSIIPVFRKGRRIATSFSLAKTIYMIMSQKGLGNREMVQVVKSTDCSCRGPMFPASTVGLATAHK